MNREITQKVIMWARERDLEKQSPKMQMIKLTEEVQELWVGLINNDRDEIIDGIGDIQVVLIVLCEQMGLNYDSCLTSAYEEIKNRKGKIVDGLFVKEAKDE